MDVTREIRQITGSTACGFSVTVGERMFDGLPAVKVNVDGLAFSFDDPYLLDELAIDLLQARAWLVAEQAKAARETSETS